MGPGRWGGRGRMSIVAVASTVPPFDAVRRLQCADGRRAGRGSRSANSLILIAFRVMRHSMRSCRVAPCGGFRPLSSRASRIALAGLLTVEDGARRVWPVALACPESHSLINMLNL